MIDLLMQKYADLFEYAATLNPLVAKDKELVQEADATIRKYFEKGFVQLASAGITRQGEVLSGLQFDIKIGVHSECAEIDLVRTAVRKHLDLTHIVTVRGEGQGKHVVKTHVVYPCAACRETINQFFPDAWVMVNNGDDDPSWISAVQADNLIKLPIKILYPKSYGQRVRTRSAEELEREWLKDRTR